MFNKPEVTDQLQTYRLCVLLVLNDLIESQVDKTTKFEEVRLILGVVEPLYSSRGKGESILSIDVSKSVLSHGCRSCGGRNVSG